MKFTIKKLVIKKTDSEDLKEIKAAINAIIEFHEQYHNLQNITHGGGGC